MHPDDIDFTVGGSLERHVPGTEAGPTFNCILMEQFYRVRVGDRYFFESGNSPHPFTPGAKGLWLCASGLRVFSGNTLH